MLERMTMKNNEYPVGLLIEDWYRKISKKIDIEDVADVRTTMIYSDISTITRVLRSSAIKSIFKGKSLQGYEYF